MPFEKGVSGNPGGKPKGGKRPSRLLRDMRRVYAQDKSNDKTQGEKRCRELLETDKRGFMTQLSQLERAYGAAAGGAANAAADPDQADQGTQETLDLIDKLLAECADG